jgi:hypothetical protein
MTKVELALSRVSSGSSGENAQLALACLGIETTDTTSPEKKRRKETCNPCRTGYDVLAADAQCRFEIE